ncbi:hypothetical protein [Paenibacillus sp. MBLB4367]|uniref:hypothetical protein n=1 Tax=Paenibacillus sp. MBLB4367 TaxID=3384767 RepID=UPI003908311F
MGLMRGRITVEEAKELIDPAARERLLNQWEEPVVGDPFIIFGQDEIHYYIKDNEIDEIEYRIYYTEDCVQKSVAHDDCIPLLDVAQMIDVLSCDQHLQIQSYGGGWLIISDGLHLEETKDLCGTLWKMTKMLLNS